MHKFGGESKSWLTYGKIFKHIKALCLNLLVSNEYGGRWWKKNRGKEEKLVKARGRTWGHTLTG